MKRIFILVGPSGSGKDTLGNYLETIGIPELVSHTTREMRNGEVDGISYHFVNKDEFDKVEKIEESEYSGNYYCLSKKEVNSKLNEFNSVFAITDIHGMNQIAKLYPKETISIFVSVTEEEMINRMTERGDSKQSIKERIQNSTKNNELKNGKYCDYTVRNNILEDAIKELHTIVK